MKLKYRVKGKVESAFILRGLHFAVDSEIDVCIYESELQFVQGRCNVSELINLQDKPIESPEPVLETPKTENESKPKGVKNGQKSNSASKAKHKENLRLA